MRYVALLRGVNVNGITVRSAELKALFIELGFESVKTILPSGNVLFDTDDTIELKARIETALSERFGYEAWIVLRSQAEMATIATACPFPADAEERHAYVVFGSDDRVLAELATTDEARKEGVVSGESVLYWDVARGSTLETPFAKVLAKAKYKPHVTSRNLRTVLKLAEA